MRRAIAALRRALREWRDRSPGLLGQILAIVLLTVMIEFTAGTLLYERASHFSLQEDEAHRLAEHLVISRKLISERPWRERPNMAMQLSTERYEVRWMPMATAVPALAPKLKTMQRQILTWEPSLTDTDLRLRLTSLGRGGRVQGALRLHDHSWIYFSTREALPQWELAFGRMGLALIAAIAIFVIAGVLLRRALDPLRALAKMTERIESDDTIELPESSTTEVQRLINAFQAMRDRIHRLINDRTEALAAVGHDMRTPLSRLRLRMDELPDSEPRDAMIADVVEMEAMIESLLAFLAGDSDPEPVASVDIAVMLDTLVEQVNDSGGSARYQGPAHLEARVRRSLLRRAASNLIDNALHHGGHADVHLTARPDSLLIAVEDNGPGIPEDQIAAVVRPFRRVDSARSRNTRGLGLGLAVVTKAMEMEGGTLQLANREQGGLRAELRLPRLR